jgi:hypothetical protein
MQHPPIAAAPASKVDPSTQTAPIEQQVPKQQMPPAKQFVLFCTSTHVSEEQVQQAASPSCSAAQPSGVQSGGGSVVEVDIGVFRTVWIVVVMTSTLIGPLAVKFGGA